MADSPKTDPKKPDPKAKPAPDADKTKSGAQEIQIKRGYPPMR